MKHFGNKNSFKFYENFKNYATFSFQKKKHKTSPNYIFTVINA